MQLTQSSSEDYRERAARVRRGARHAGSPDVSDTLLRLAAKYDELADKGYLTGQRDDEVVMFRRLRCGFHAGTVVLYYLD
jgi:hypothetical protein